MQGLYKKVVRGQFPRIPNIYSPELCQVIKLMLQVSPNMRPDSGKLLSSPLLSKWLGVGHSPLQPVDLNNELLHTIRIPKNLHLLSAKLPKPT